MIYWYVKLFSKNSFSCFFISHSCLSYPLHLQAPDKHGLTPLMAACFEDHLSCVKVLLEKVGSLIWACIHARIYIYLYTKVQWCHHHCIFMCQRFHVGHRCWWGNSLDKRPFNLWRLCWNVHRAPHSFVAIRFFCICDFKAGSFIGAQSKFLPHPCTL